MNDELPQSSPSEELSTELARLVDLVERLHRDHTVSFIAAGDEKIYAYGGNGFVAIVSESLFDAAVDIETPAMKFRVEREASGRIATSPVAGAEGPTARDVAATVDGLERYYARRVGIVTVAP